MVEKMLTERLVLSKPYGRIDTDNMNTRTVATDTRDRPWQRKHLTDETDDWYRQFV